MQWEEKLASERRPERMVEGSSNRPARRLADLIQKTNTMSVAQSFETSHWLGFSWLHIKRRNLHVRNVQPEQAHICTPGP
jgi:hypothetical protein